jgi:hypothetical protein
MKNLGFSTNACDFVLWIAKLLICSCHWQLELWNHVFKKRRRKMKIYGKVREK